MTRPYSMDLRDRAVARVLAGESVRSVALALIGSAATVVRWSQRYRTTGSAAPGKVGGHKPNILSGPRVGSGFWRELLQTSRCGSCSPSWRITA